LNILLLNPQDLPTFVLQHSLKVIFRSALKRPWYDKFTIREY